VADPPSAGCRKEAEVEQVMAYVYVLKSIRNNKRYVGFTTKTIEERMRQHCSGSTQWTRQNAPFEIIYYEEIEDIKAARKRERYFKTGQGRRLLDNILKK